MGVPRFCMNVKRSSRKLFRVGSILNSYNCRKFFVNEIFFVLDAMLFKSSFYQVQFFATPDFTSF